MPFSSTLPDLRTVAGRMKIARLATGLSTVELAKRQGEHPTAVRRRESGSRSFPLEQVQAMARRSRCTVRWLDLGEAGDAPEWLAGFDHVRHDGSLFQRIMVPPKVSGPLGYLVYAAELLNQGLAASRRDAFNRGLAQARATGRGEPTPKQLEQGWAFFRATYREPQVAAA